MVLAPALSLVLMRNHLSFFQRLAAAAALLALAAASLRVASSRSGTSTCEAGRCM